MNEQVIADKWLEQVNTAAEAMKNLTELTEVDVATAPKTSVWQDGKVQLFHFDRTTKAKAKTPVLIVYALVNRWEMMDLQPDRSFIRKMVEEGVDTYVIDWGYASFMEQYKTLEEYIQGNINDCVDHIRKAHGVDKVNIMGVCQGGTFSLIYSALNPEKVKNLITLVTPVDFDNEDGLLFKWAKNLDVDQMVNNFGGVVPGDFLNNGFDLLKPMNKARKYLSMPKTMKNMDTLMNFLRMEHWVADSPDQAGDAYRCFIKDMYQKNKLVKGEFELAGKKVSLKNITMPVLTIYAKEDHIVPPATTRPINEAIGSKDKELLEFPGGHIGVFVGSRSQKVLTPTIAKWLIDRD